MLSRRPALVFGLAASLVFLLVLIPYRSHVSYASTKAAERLANFRWHVEDTNSLGTTPSSSSSESSSSSSSSADRDARPASWGWWKSSQSSNVDHSLDYRKHLEETTSPVGYTHQRTMSFSHIYVLNLHHRADRRERMTKIARALGLDFTFVNATNKDLPVIQWIGERVKEVRRWKKPHLDKILDGTAVTGGMAIGSVWLWNNYAEKGMELPDIRGLDKRWGGKNWVDHLESSDPATLIPDDPNFNVTGELWDHSETNDFRQIRDAVIATWYSQTRVWNLMQENDDESALVLEDDIDMEWDIERMWAAAHRRLPEDWEASFLGHCWGREMGKPAYIHPLLHQSSEPRCLHGYAFSRRGYNKLISMMREPWIAYQTAVDTAIPTFITEDMLNAYSIDPSIIIQSKDTPSDIQAGIGSPWRGVLADSTMERIWKDEGHEVAELTWEEAVRNPHPDPATVWRVSPSRVDREKAARQKAAAKAAQDLLDKQKASGGKVVAPPPVVPDTQRGREKGPGRWTADVLGQQRQANVQGVKAGHVDFEDIRPGDLVDRPKGRQTNTKEKRRRTYDA